MPRNSLPRSISRGLPVVFYLTILIAPLAAVGAVRFGHTDSRPSVQPLVVTDLAVARSHACALPASGRLICWGEDGGNMAVAPPGKFEQISAGASFTCGLRTTGRARCWGSFPDTATHLKAPAGRFITVATNRQSACGLRPSGRVVCWKDAAALRASEPAAALRHGVEIPRGRFTAISAGRDITCGLRSTHAVACWGIVPIPPGLRVGGRLVQVSVGDGAICGVRLHGALACAGRGMWPPAGSFRQVSAGRRAACAIGRAGSVVCWGPWSSQLRRNTPSGVFRSIGVGFRYACGFRVSGTLLCWGRDVVADSFGPSGDFVKVASGSDLTCGLAVGRHVTCFAYGASVFTLPGRYTDIAASRELPGLWCAVRSGGSALCWQQTVADPGPVGNLTLRHFPGRFAGVALGGFGVSKSSHSFCARRTNGTIRCWGPLKRATPPGPFSGLSVGNGFACGVRAGGRAACWGANKDGQSTPPPATRFHEISVGIDDACGVTLAERIACWGDDDNPAVRAPKRRFTDVELMPSFERGGSEDYGCGMELTGRITCWGAGTSLVPPTGKFVRWSLGVNTLCGVDRLGGLRCRGNPTLNIPGRRAWSQAESGVN